MQIFARPMNSSATAYPAMHENLSLYLDFLRLLAAFAVVVDHAYGILALRIPRALALNGPEAVSVFFVLSGFVIRFVTTEKNEKNLRVYLLARVVRMASVVPLALIATVCADLIVEWLGSKAPAHHWLALMRAITFTNELWFSHSVFGSNEPYWSLGFEVPYYLMFAIMIFSSGYRRNILLLIWTMFYGAKILAYLPLWLLGVVLYNIITKLRVRRIWFGLALMGSGLTVYLFVKFGLNHPFYRIYRPRGIFDLVAGASYYYSIGIAIALNIMGFHLATVERSSFPKKITAPIRWLAGGSFTLYLIHLPLLGVGLAFDPTIRTTMSGGYIVLLAVIGACYVLAELGERRKASARQIVESIYCKYSDVILYIKRHNAVL